VRWATGFTSGATSCGIKDGSAPDLAVLCADRTVNWAGVFTLNAAAAAPVQWCRRMLGRPVRGIVTNSGNANACTGSEGVEAVQRTAATAAAAWGCSSEEVLVASTGPIGVPLPTDLITAALPSLCNGTDPAVEGFATAIMTTDTRIKTSSVPVGDAVVTGVAKGAAMVAPNMATMLAFLTTDADVDGPSLQAVLRAAVDASFNAISIDGCESTNDSVFLMASGAAGKVDEGAFGEAVATVCADLARQIVEDAEGGTRTVRILVDGATTPAAATALGRAVASSVLWRSALHGGDPNWGRIVSALGATDRELVLDQLQVSIGPEVVFSDGEPVGSLEAAAKAMGDDEVVVSCVVGRGPGTAEILSTDLSEEYVSLNAEIST
jgi:glutamate N-acetyltransferase/amino-acid N-acetyltransferase